jgi:hypothetical protein
MRRHAVLASSKAVQQEAGIPMLFAEQLSRVFEPLVARLGAAIVVLAITLAAVMIPGAFAPCSSAVVIGAKGG